MYNFHDILLYCGKGIFISFIALIILPGCHSTILKVKERESVRLDFPYACDSTVNLLKYHNLPGNFKAMYNFQDFLLNCRKGILITFIALITLPGCHSTILRVIEGKRVHLDFPYPCDSTEVTLQHGNGRPFYRSANPQHISQSPNQDLTNHIDSESDQCFLNLTINPVLRNNEGTFILMAYKDGIMLPDYTRIGLRVKYPPGKASCEIGNEYEGWVSLRCTAPKGTLPGQILCYQNDMRLPRANEPTGSGETLIQNVLAKLNETHLIHCCSSTLHHRKGKCECKEWGWNPKQNIVTSGTVDPCPQVLSTQGIASSFEITTDIANSLISDQPTAITKYLPMQMHSQYYIWLVAYEFALVMFILTVTALSIAYCRKVRQLKRLQSSDETQSSASYYRVSDNKEKVREHV